MAKAAVPATMKLVLAIILSLFTLTVFASRVERVTNPCWVRTLEGMEPLDGMIDRDPFLYMDPDCFGRVGITSSMKMCSFFCNSYYSVGDTEDCLKNCDSVRDGKTMIILIPGEVGFFGKAGGTFNDPKWLLDAKPKVYNILGCKLNDVVLDDEASRRCLVIGSGEDIAWQCMPLSDYDLKSFRVTNVRSADGKACTITISE